MIRKTTQPKGNSAFTVKDDNDLEAIDRCYRYLDRYESPLWLAGMPGAPPVDELRQLHRAWLAATGRAFELVEVERPAQQQRSTARRQQTSRRAA